MKKSFSLIAAAAMAASLTLAGSMSAFASDTDEPTTQSTTEAATEAATEAEPSIKIDDIVGKWKFENTKTNYLFVGDTDDLTNSYEIGGDASIFSGTVEIKADGTYTLTNDKTTENGTVKIGTETIESTVADTVNFYVGEEFKFGGYYHSDTDEISIGNGGTDKLVRDNGETETSTTTEGTSTSTTSTTTTTATTTASTSSTAKSSTTAAGSPKTGVAFPALAVAGLGVSAAAVAFVLRKKED